MTTALFETHIPDLELIARGKVRDIYNVDEDHLLIVTTDRLSAFDVILPTPIAGKGITLTQIAKFWFKRLEHIIPNHLSSLPLSEVITDERLCEDMKPRSMLVKKLKPLPVEAIARGYLIGSGWKDYQANGSVCGIDLPTKLQLADQLPEPIYTPSTKADVGDHDINISYEDSVELMGEDLASKVRDTTLQLYKEAAEYARDRGIIIADTKFEFGMDNSGKLFLIDEALTPDSSRFWPVEEYSPGISPPSFDKQFIRDYLETIDWDKTPPGPDIPDEIAQKTSDKYQEASDRLM